MWLFGFLRKRQPTPAPAPAAITPPRVDSNAEALKFAAYHADAIARDIEQRLQEN